MYQENASYYNVTCTETHFCVDLCVVQNKIKQLLKLRGEISHQFSPGGMIFWVLDQVSARAKGLPVTQRRRGYCTCMATPRRRGYCTCMVVTAGTHEKTFIICKKLCCNVLVPLTAARQTGAKKKSSHVVLRSISRPVIRYQHPFTISRSWVKLLKIPHFRLKCHPINYISIHSETC